MDKIKAAAWINLGMQWMDEGEPLPNPELADQIADAAAIVLEDKELQEILGRAAVHRVMAWTRANLVTAKAAMKAAGGEQ